MIHHYDTRNGLRGPGVNSMVLDTRGFLWIGTNAGLTRFDGAHFRTFPMPSGSEGSFAYSPRMMDVDRYNRLWIATKRGLYIFDISTERFEQYDTCMISDDEFIRFVRVDQSGNVWAASDKSQYCIYALP